jgi:hypothetical protein
MFGFWVGHNMIPVPPRLEQDQIVRRVEHLAATNKKRDENQPPSNDQPFPGGKGTLEKMIFCPMVFRTLQQIITDCGNAY